MKKMDINGILKRYSVSAALIAALAALILAAAFIHTASVSEASSWPSFRGNDDNNAVISWKTPREQKEAGSLWTKSFGKKVSGMSMWAYSPNTPIIVDGKVVTSSSKEIMKLDPDTGEVIQSAELSAAVNWGYTPITYAKLSDGRKVLFCPLSGKIEAVDFDTLEKIWTYEAPKTSGITSQSISPIVFSGDMVFTGFYTAYDKENSYVGIDAKTGKEVWRYKSGGGFYWNGGVAVGNALIVGTQDGMNNNDVTGSSGGQNYDSYIMSFDRKTGNVISKLKLTKASDICSTIVYDRPPEGNGRVYWTSCAGMLLSAAVDPDTGELSGLKSKTLSGKDPLTVNTPVVYKDRVYLGYKSSEAYGYFAAYDKESLSEVFKVELRGYPKGSPLITTAYESAGYLYAYVPYYQEPGGVQVVKLRKDAKSAKDAEVSDLFDANGYEQYSAGSLIVDDRGVLYYKNDSNALFAFKKSDPVELPVVKGLKLRSTTKKKKATVKASWKKAGKATGYRVLYRVNEKGAWKNLISEKTSAKIKVSNGSFLRVRVRAEYTDAVKTIPGDYSDDAMILAGTSSIKKLSKGRGSFTIKYDKHKGAKGYQVSWSINKSMKKAKTLKVKGASKTSAKVKALKSGKTYYVRVRSLRKTGGKTFYGKKSKVKKVKL